jgi:predicted dienelactone hydrolase
VLVAVGGVPDLAKISQFCQAHSDQDLCQAMKHAGIDPRFGADVPVGAWVHDRRLTAVVIAAPAFGFVFGRAGLGGIRVPIQLWRAADDRHQPSPYYDEAVRADLPRLPEYHVVQNAGHYDFLPPCDARLTEISPDICSSSSGFDRAAFHRQFDAEVVRFFLAKLRLGLLSAARPRPWRQVPHQRMHEKGLKILRRLPFTRKIPPIQGSVLCQLAQFSPPIPALCLL